jgi:hypothetical protein
MPKQKFLFYVRFLLDDTVAFDANTLNPNEKIELGYLVKSCDLPKYGINLEEKVQYNKKMYTSTRIQYEPVNITFHDDHADTVNAFWKRYLEYNVADSVSMFSDAEIQQTKDDYYDAIQSNGSNRINKFGLDTPKRKKKPYIRRIEIFCLHKQRFTSMSLINPLIGSFSHDNLDQADGAGVLQNIMQVFYETVIYKSGVISKGAVPGFATIHYDHEPSPLTVLGGGTNSIFGPGGVVDGIGSVLGGIRDGNYLGAILAASNTYNNAKKLKKKDVKSELKGIAKKGILEVGKQAGTITNPVSQFSVGAAAALGSAAIIASQRGENTANTRVITQTTQDYTKVLTADESYNLVTTDSSIKDEIAAGIYYKDIGSRKNLTIAQSDVEYNNSSDTVKTVYRNKSITDVRKLVTNGYLRIDRSTQNVSISTEKANI